jgi:hypothetical protein
MCPTIPRIFLLVLLMGLALGAPDSFSWDNVNETTFVPEVHSQNFPGVCNSGWAFSAVDVLNSRMKIKRKG